jgi:hypothetical protein
VESTGGAIELIIENYKWGVYGRRVSIGAFIRGWKNIMRHNNENIYYNFFLFYPASVRQTVVCTSVSYVLTLAHVV